MRLQFCVLWFSWRVTVVMWWVGGDHNSVHVSCLQQSIGEGIQPNICLYSPVGVIQSRSSTSSNKHTITTIPNYTSPSTDPQMSNKSPLAKKRRRGFAVALTILQQKQDLHMNTGWTNPQSTPWRTRQLQAGANTTYIKTKGLVIRT